MTGHKKHHSKKTHKEDLSVDFDNSSIYNGLHSLSSPDSRISPASIEGLILPIHPERHRFSFTADEKVENLTQLNETLVKLVASLKSEKQKLMTKLTELKEQIENNESNVIALLSGNKEGEQSRDEASLEIPDHRKLASSLAEENAALLAEQFCISNRKEKLENILRINRKKLGEFYKEMELAQAAAREANARVDALNAEILKRSYKTKALNAENESLKMLSRDKDCVLKQLQICTGVLEQEHHVVVLDLEKALVESAGIAEVKVDYMRIEESRFQEKNRDLNRALKEALEHFTILSNQNMNANVTIEDLAATVSDLHKKLDASKTQLNKTLTAFQMEQEVDAGLGKDISTTVSENRSIQHNLNSVRVSVSMLQENSHQREKRIAVLEKQILTLFAEKIGLQESKSDLELEAKHLSTGSAERLKVKKAELFSLQEKVQLLEAAITQRTEESKSSATKICQLITELNSVKAHLKEKALLAKYTVSIAATSTSALALISLFAYFQSRK